MQRRDFSRMKTFHLTLVIFLLLQVSVGSVSAQFLSDNDSAFKAMKPNSARLWGYIFGDYFFKSHADSLNRGGNNQYTNVKQGTNEFQLRRVYLGFDYNLNKTFSTEFLLAAEDDFPTGDLLSNNKFTPYLKYANVRWHNIFKGTDFTFGLQPTPSFPFMSEYIFSMTRPSERTVTDIRRTPSFDFGFGLQGRYYSGDQSVVFGYDLLVANGTSDKPQTLTAPVYKWFYGDAFVGFLKRRLVFDIYTDYQRQNWTGGKSYNHAARQMTKGVLAWTTPKFTIGTEMYVNGLMNAEQATTGGVRDTLSGIATGTSWYAHYVVLKGLLRIYARYDTYNPNTKYNTSYTKWNSLYSVSTSYDPSNKERFLNVGLDFIPTRNIHIIPNVWYDKYIGQAAGLSGAAAHDYDLVWRLTFFFTFGKLFAYPSYTYYH
jgi:hypothetical protein